MEKQNNPKLELKLNEMVKVSLLRDKAYEGKNGFGPYYLYSVSHLGVEKSFFAPVEIHEQIVAHALHTGSEFILHKKASQNGKKITGELIFEPVETKTFPKNGKGNGHTDHFRDVMDLSLREAVEITQAVAGVPFQNEDIQKIASCLFIARTRIN
jgi:hypothetical protein